MFYIYILFYFSKTQRPKKKKMKMVVPLSEPGILLKMDNYPWLGTWNLFISYI